MGNFEPPDNRRKRELRNNLLLLLLHQIEHNFNIQDNVKLFKELERGDFSQLSTIFQIKGINTQNIDNLITIRQLKTIADRHQVSQMKIVSILTDVISQFSYSLDTTKLEFESHLQ